jgi:hypothetical protein
MTSPFAKAQAFLRRLSADSGVDTGSRQSSFNALEPSLAAEKGKVEKSLSMMLIAKQWKLLS